MIVETMPSVPIRRQILGRLIAASRTSRNNGPPGLVSRGPPLSSAKRASETTARREDFAISGEFVLEVADEGGSGDDQAGVFAVVKRLFELAENKGGFSGSGAASD